MIIALHELLCAAIFYSVFCRSVRMNGTTRSDIRFALITLGAVAAFGIAVPIHWQSWRPEPFELSLLASIAFVQVVTAYHWIDGVPERFLRKPDPAQPLKE